MSRLRKYGELTNEEKIELFERFIDGEEIERSGDYEIWHPHEKNTWSDKMYYRRKLEVPVPGTVHVNLETFRLTLIVTHYKIIGDRVGVTTLDTEGVMGHYPANTFYLNFTEVTAKTPDEFYENTHQINRRNEMRGDKKVSGFAQMSNEKLEELITNPNTRGKVRLKAMNELAKRK